MSDTNRAHRSVKPTLESLTGRHLLSAFGPTPDAAHPHGGTPTEGSQVLGHFGAGGAVPGGAPVDHAGDHGYLPLWHSPSSGGSMSSTTIANWSGSTDFMSGASMGHLTAQEDHANMSYLEITSSQSSGSGGGQARTIGFGSLQAAPSPNVPVTPMAPGMTPSPAGTSDPVARFVGPLPVGSNPIQHPRGVSANYQTTPQEQADINAYNASVDAFKQQIATYNSRVDIYDSVTKANYDNAVSAFQTKYQVSFDLKLANEFNVVTGKNETKLVFEIPLKQLFAKWGNAYKTDMANLETQSANAAKAYNNLEQTLRQLNMRQMQLVGQQQSLLARYPNLILVPNEP